MSHSGHWEIIQLGYLAPDSNASPRTNVTFWEVIKWCNARSEKNGLKPAYYIDGDEFTTMSTEMELLILGSMFSAHTIQAMTLT